MCTVGWHWISPSEHDTICWCTNLHNAAGNTPWANNLQNEAWFKSVAVPKPQIRNMKCGQASVPNGCVLISVNTISAMWGRRKLRFLKLLIGQLKRNSKLDWRNSDDTKYLGSDMSAHKDGCNPVKCAAQEVCALCRKKQGLKVSLDELKNSLTQRGVVWFTLWASRLHNSKALWVTALKGDISVGELNLISWELNLIVMKKPPWGQRICSVQFCWVGCWEPIHNPASSHR